ncbi:type II secretion system F family protein [Nocardioides sp. GY 10127]|uniref:type II secretion system F family protein n=1 Tax=Nocardioides sp. GY 10127 TaxID=2569762 RepID=UPI0010A788B3|nr:type II secretion system F family protein [Nocardioides sp. GY 10127]TIC78579.1 type II secretion system protein [Nocardioides sp. GY 10127]
MPPLVWLPALLLAAAVALLVPPGRPSLRRDRSRPATAHEAPGAAPAGERALGAAAARRRRRREERQASRDLPALVALVAAGLAAGAAPSGALLLAVVVLPGPAAQRLRPTARALELGVDPGAVWGELAADPALGRLGRTLDRAHRTGASVAGAVDRLAVQMGEESRTVAEDAARAVGVRAAVPLGLLLLPSFVLLGIVPVAAGMLSGLLA